MTAASWYHCSVKPVSRSAGRSVVAAAAYRIGQRLEDHEYGELRDYTRRSGVVTAFTLAPEHADWACDPERLWNAAEAAEKRRNSQVARECELALPAALSTTERESIVRTFAQDLVARYGVAVTVAIHLPSRHGDERNHHAHLLMTTREVKAEGLGKKTRVLDAKATGPAEVRWMRQHAADLINEALEAAGSDERVDHRSFADRGVVREPTTHLGPTASNMERRGKPTERGRANRETRERNAELDALVGELASLDAEIVAEQERALDARYGPASPEPSPPLNEAELAGREGQGEPKASRVPDGVSPSEVRPARGTAIEHGLRSFFRDATPELFEMPAKPTRPGWTSVAGTVPQPAPLTAQEAEQMVRAIASQFAVRDLALGREQDAPRGEAYAFQALPRFDRAHDAQGSAEQVEAVAALLVAAIERAGELPDLVTRLVDSGLDWWQHAAQYLADLAREVRETVQNALTWRDHARLEREERNRDPDDTLDFD